MCKLCKGCSVIVILFLFSFFYTKVDAASSYFIWEKTEIDVPIFSSLEEYKDDYVLKLYVNGLRSKDYYVEYETNCSTFSTVLTNKIGRYTVYYKAYSKANNISSEQAIIFNVVDITPPRITLDYSEINVNYGNTLSDFNWYTVTDDTCSFDDIKIDLDETGINYQMLGTYTGFLSATDKYGNKCNTNFKVKVVDNVKPQIQVLKPLVFNCGDVISLEEFFLCTDNYDGDVTSLLEVYGLDLKTIGKKEITLIAKDKSQNELKVVFEVIVEDNEPPIIILTNDEIILDIREYILYDEEYFLKYIEVFDNLTKENEISLNIDISSLENDIIDCSVNYIAIDEKGNQAEATLIVKIRELIGPQIIVDDVIDIFIGEEVDFLSLVEVVDEYDLNAVDRVSVDSGVFDNNKCGKYKIKYTCFNTSGIYTEKIITVNVKEIESSIEYSNLILYAVLTVVVISVLIVVILKSKNKKF